MGLVTFRDLVRSRDQEKGQRESSELMGEKLGDGGTAYGREYFKN